MPKSKPAIILKNVSKTYVLHHEKPTFVETVIKRGHKEKFQALKKVSLQINQGEKVGIIGPNGAGKTTLLKIIAGITQPTSGQVKTYGKIVSLIDLAAGFHPELTGEENIFLNGLLIGMSKAQIKAKFKQIVAFADIGDFIDSPLYTYSSGMKLRVGFSIAVHSEPDILLLDEGISVGDERFRERAEAQIQSLFAQNKTVVMVSHQLRFIKRNCERLFLAKQGLVKMITNQEIKQYKRGKI